MRKRSAAQAERKSRLTDLASVAKKFSEFRPANEELRIVRAFPTCFVQFDHATKVGGFPLERFTLAHGKSGDGKTYFTLGLLDSCLELNNPAMLIDAERTTPITFARTVMKNADHPLFFASRPDTYEETTALVRKFCLNVKEQRDDGILPPDSTALIVVDSIKKLVPAKIWDLIMKDVEKNGIDGVGGAAGRLKAALNAQWLDELTPLLEDTGTTMVAIARERENPDADQWAKKAGRDYTVGGGKAIYYDASMVIRIEAAGFSQTGGDAEGKGKVVYGRRHRVVIRKSKVAGQEERETISFFHTSNGVLVPEGFDRGRDVLEMAVRFDIVEKSGAWFSYDGERLGQGEHNTVKFLTEHADCRARIESIVRSRFNLVEPIEYNAATGEVMS